MLKLTVACLHIHRTLVCPLWQVYGVDQFLSQRVSVANAGAKLQGQVIDFAARSAGLALLQNSIAALPITGTASSSWG